MTICALTRLSTEDKGDGVGSKRTAQKRQRSKVWMAWTLIPNGCRELSLMSTTGGSGLKHELSLRQNLRHRAGVLIK